MGYNERNKPEVRKIKDIFVELQDMRHLDWAERKLSPGTPGCFLKAYDEMEGIRYYYKLSNYDSYRGVFGHESVNELIASRLLSVLGIPHVKYQLIHALITIDDNEIETWISCSKNFRKENDKEVIFKDIDQVLSRAHIEKIWEMIWKRWQHYETLCNKK